MNLCRGCEEWRVADCWRTRRGRCDLYSGGRLRMGVGAQCLRYRRQRSRRATCPYHAVDCTARNVRLCLMSAQSAERRMRPVKTPLTLF